MQWTEGKHIWDFLFDEEIPSMKICILYGRSINLGLAVCPVHFCQTFSGNDSNVLTEYTVSYMLVAHNNWVSICVNSYLDMNASHSN